MTKKKFAYIYIYKEKGKKNIRQFRKIISTTGCFYLDKQNKQRIDRAEQKEKCTNLKLGEQIEQSLVYLNVLRLSVYG